MALKFLLLAMKRPENEKSDYTYDYIKLVNDDVLSVLNEQITSYPALISTLDDKENYTYLPGKWTVKEVVQHTIDTERILSYRLLAFARLEKQPLPGFEQSEYALAVNVEGRTLISLVDEFVCLRKANMFLFNSLSEEELERTGLASGIERSVRKLLFTIAGHLEHHLNILNEKYS